MEIAPINPNFVSLKPTDLCIQIFPSQADLNTSVRKKSEELDGKNF
jgi:hypothetical protein